MISGGQEGPDRREVYSPQVTHSSGLSRILLPLLTAVVLKVESLYVHYSVLGGKSPLDEPGPELCALLILAIGLSFLPATLCRMSCFLATSAATALWVMDASYYRFFRDLPSWHLLPTWHQAGKASQSLSSIFEPDDFRLLLGPVVVALLAFADWRWRRRRQSGFALPCLSLLITMLVCVKVYDSLHPVRWEQLQRRFQNIALARIFGPFYYHVYDSYEYLRATWHLEGRRPFDEGEVKRAILQSRDRATQPTQFQGIFEGRDIIFIQLESLEYFAVEAEFEGRPVMPNMQRLAKLGFGFRLFDQTHLGRSADAQFIFLNSLHPPADRPLAFVYPNNQYSGLPYLFREKGYDTIYLHPSDPSFWNAEGMAKAYGFETRLFRDELPVRDRDTEVRGWGLSDEALFTRVVERTRKVDKPFFAYVVTLMCHHPYPETPPDDTDFPPPKGLSMVRRYLRCCNTRDKAIGSLIESLAKTPRGRRAVLCLVGDHDSNITESEKERLLLPTFPESEAVPLVICPVENAISGKPLLDGLKPPVNFGAQMDLAPSLGHVFSLDMEQSVFLGWNLFFKQNMSPRLSRLGTWMDNRGVIRPSDDRPKALDISEFEVSEMLIQNDRVAKTRQSF